jgi:hypothetical protein
MTPMMVNLYVRSLSGGPPSTSPPPHLQRQTSTNRNAPSRCIHVHFTIFYLPSLFKTRACPYCEHCVPNFPRWQPQRHVVLDDPANLFDQRQAYGHQPPHAARGFVDEEARESSEYQTSGFGTPRQSVETLGSVEGGFAEGMMGRDSMEGKHAASLV